MKESIDSVAEKAQSAIDTSKVKAKQLIEKGAEKVELEAKKVKEKAAKN
jgi:RNase adaptor protein for sRNA GlmZ degradation